MSNADPESVSTLVEGDGVTVEKSFEPDDFPVPAIAFVIRSAREEPVEVTIVERMPSGVDAEDIGLHPKYGAEFWSLEDDRIVFERDFQPDEEYTTVYGVRARDRDNVERFLDEPELRVEPEADRESVVGEIVGDGDSSSIEAAIGALERDGEDADTDTDVEVPTVDSSSIEAAIGAVEGPPAPEAQSPTAAENLASALADQLRAGQVSQADLEVLREAFSGEVGGSVDARVGRLQREVSDLQAYTDALEAFLDENGDAQTLLAELQSDLDAFDADIEKAVSGANAAEETVADLEAEFDSLESRVSALVDLDERVTHVEGQVDDLETLDERVKELTDLGAQVEAVETTTGDLQRDVAELDSGVEGLSEDMGGVNENVESIESDVGRLRSDLEGVREEVADGSHVEALEGRLESLEDELDGVRDDLQELAQMREQLRSVFGAGALSTDDDEE
jgi:predicted  nucleic acid-binding Zn-ribbon protein